MSASDGGMKFLEEAKGVNPTDASRRGISGVILAFFAGLAFIVETFLGGIASLGAVFDDIRAFLSGLFTGPLEILQVSAEASAIATQQFGILAFVVGVGIIIAAFRLWDASNVELPIVDRFNFRGRD
jgi:hypothetical protein